MSIESVLASQSLIKGFLVPVFYDEHGRGSALDTEGFEKVRQGYACAYCLCEYTMYLVRCPVCQRERDITRDLEAPHQDHVDHLRERQGGMDTAVPQGFEEFMRSVNADENIEKIDVKKLLPKRGWRK